MSLIARLTGRADSVARFKQCHRINASECKFIKYTKVSCKHRCQVLGGRISAWLCHGTACAGTMARNPEAAFLMRMHIMPSFTSPRKLFPFWHLLGPRLPSISLSWPAWLRGTNIHSQISMVEQTICQCGAECACLQNSRGSLGKQPRSSPLVESERRMPPDLGN